MTWNTVLSIVPRDRVNEAKVIGSIPMGAISFSSFYCLSPATLLTLTPHPSHSSWGHRGNWAGSLDAEVNQPLPSAREIPKVKAQSCGIVPTGAGQIIPGLFLLLLSPSRHTGSTQCGSLVQRVFSQTACIWISVLCKESGELDKLFNISNLICLTFKIPTVIVRYRVAERSGSQETTQAVACRWPWSCRLVSSQWRAHRQASSQGCNVKFHMLGGQKQHKHRGSSLVALRVKDTKQIVSEARLSPEASESCFLLTSGGPGMPVLVGPTLLPPLCRYVQHPFAI